MDKLTSMAVLVKAVETGSFAAAARHFRISAVMVGKHIKGLEDELGVRLLNRTTRRLALTEAGRSYFQRSMQILGEVEVADREARDAQVRLRGVLRVSSSYGFGRVHLAAAVAAFSVRHPDVTIDATFDNRIVNLIEEGIDLAIRSGEPEDSSLICRHIAPCSMVVCASPDYLKQHGRPVTIEDLGTHNCLEYKLGDTPNRWPFGGDGGVRGVAITGRIKTNGGDFLRTLALDGAGIVRLPSFLIGEDLLTGRLVPLLRDFAEQKIAILALYPHSGRVPAKVRAFIDFLVERFGPNPPWERWLLNADRSQ